jgi:hypothetical protein
VGPDAHNYFFFTFFSVLLTFFGVIHEISGEEDGYSGRVWHLFIETDARQPKKIFKKLVFIYVQFLKRGKIKISQKMVFTYFSAVIRFYVPRPTIPFIVFFKSFWTRISKNLELKHDSLAKNLSKNLTISTILKNQPKLLFEEI